MGESGLFEIKGEACGKVTVVTKGEGVLVVIIT